MGINFWPFVLAKNSAMTLRAQALKLNTLINWTLLKLKMWVSKGKIKKMKR